MVLRMLSHRGNVRTSNSGENRRKRSKKIFENVRRAYKDLIYVKKNSKLSHACVPLTLFYTHGFRVVALQIYVMIPLQYGFFPFLLQYR
jgi:hypothetical protein